MSLLGAYIDSRTIAAVAAEASVSFAHGLPSTPDFVIPINAATRSSNVSAAMLAVLHDTSNVTVQNYGEGASAVLRIVSVVAHSIIR